MKKIIAIPQPNTIESRVPDSMAAGIAVAGMAAVGIATAIPNIKTLYKNASEEVVYTKNLLESTMGVATPLLAIAGSLNKTPWIEDAINSAQRDIQEKIQEEITHLNNQLDNAGQDAKLYTDSLDKIIKDSQLVDAQHLNTLAEGKAQLLINEAKLSDPNISIERINEIIRDAYSRVYGEDYLNKYGSFFTDRYTHDMQSNLLDEDSGMFNRIKEEAKFYADTKFSDIVNSQKEEPLRTILNGQAQSYGLSQQQSQQDYLNALSPQERQVKIDEIYQQAYTKIYSDNFKTQYIDYFRQNFDFNAKNQVLDSDRLTQIYNERYKNSFEEVFNRSFTHQLIQIGLKSAIGFTSLGVGSFLSPFISDGISRIIHFIKTFPKRYKNKPYQSYLVAPINIRKRKTLSMISGCVAGSLLMSIYSSALVPPFGLIFGLACGGVIGTLVAGFCFTMGAHLFNYLMFKKAAITNNSKK